MKLFFKMKPLLRSAQAEEELAALRAELRGLRGALATAEAKRQELEETHVSVTQEKNDLALQLQAVRRGRAGFLSATWCPDPRASSGNPRLLRGNSTGRRTVPHSPRPPPSPPPSQGQPGMCWVLRLYLGPFCYSGGSWAHTCVRPPHTQPPHPVSAHAPVLPHPGTPWLPAKASVEPHLPSSLLCSLPETVPGSLLWLRAMGTQAAGNSNNQRAEIKGPDPPPSPQSPSFLRQTP